MYRVANSTGITGHPILASFCAGPIFVIIVDGTLIFAASPQWTGAGEVLLIIPVAIPVGFVLALIPNLLGTAALHALGKDNHATRLPVFWAIAGALLAGGGALACAAPPELAGILAATGMACALLCRWGMDWID